MMVKTGLIGEQFSSEWCHCSTTITLFNQVIHHNDKVKPKKLSSFTLIIIMKKNHWILYSALGFVESVPVEMAKIITANKTGKKRK